MAYTVQGESSSSSYTSNPTSKWKFDVFLSFAGKDTRLKFTDHLYAAFKRGGIRAFRDDEGMERGGVISSQLPQAIEDSLCAVVVLSENYANSTWCLDELQKILQCSDKLGRKVFPIFYDVDPSDVRNQRNSFEQALAKHEERSGETKDKVQNWRNSLFQISNFSGWDSRSWHETDLIAKIVGEIWTYLCSKLPSYNHNLVGINLKMVDVISHLEIGPDEVRFLGIWGMGGIGKTTLARVVYEKISNQFEICCFLANIREASEREDQVHLQNRIFSHLNVSNKDIEDTYQGKTRLRNVFCNKKVLLVLDDINHINQLENLAGSPNWFGTGSRVVITSRDSHLFVSHYVHRTYEVKTMKKDESLQLFSRKAFKKDHPEENYLELSNSIVEYAGGLPLALQVLGSFLCGRSIDVWKDAIDRLKKSPDADILRILKISYDALNEEEKTIFLDIACFFKGWRRDGVTQILEHCGLHPTIGINVLVEKTLLVEKQISRVCILEMHDLLQDLGRYIVGQESPSVSRLWKLEDIKELLQNDKGSEAIQAIGMELIGEDIEVHCRAFSNMSNIRLLILPERLKCPDGLKCLPNALKVIHWESSPLEALPLETPLDKLVDIQMPDSNIKQLWNGKQFLKKLKNIDLRYSDLTETPDFSGVPNLESLILVGCSSLVVVHPSLGELQKLVKVDLSYCESLEILPRKLETNSLRNLNIFGCCKVTVLPEFGKGMTKLSFLDVRDTAITKLPESLGFLSGLKDFHVSGCKIIDLHMLNNPITPQISGFNLTSLTELSLRDCGISDGSIPNDFGNLSSLIILDMGGNNFVNLPIGCFSSLLRLLYLFLDDCKWLKSLPELPPRVIRLNATGCESMESLSDGQLWGLVSSLNHKHRCQTNYENTLLQHFESEYVPQRDFCAIITGFETPFCFPNQYYPWPDDSMFEIKVDIPEYFRASEWSGIVVCLNISCEASFGIFHISWSSKAPEDDKYICKQWDHGVTMKGSGSSRQLCIMVLEFNEKTCWQHLRGDNNCLHIQLNYIEYPGVRVLGCGWRMLCKEEMEKLCNPNCFFRLTQPRSASTSCVYLPDSVLRRTLSIL